MDGRWHGHSFVVAPTHGKSKSSTWGPQVDGEIGQSCHTVDTGVASVPQGPFKANSRDFRKGFLERALLGILKAKNMGLACVR